MIFVGYMQSHSSSTKTPLLDGISVVLIVIGNNIVPFVAAFLFFFYPSARQTSPSVSRLASAPSFLVCTGFFCDSI